MKLPSFARAVVLASIVGGLASTASQAAPILSFSDPAATPSTLYFKYSGLGAFSSQFLAAEITFDLLSINQTQARFGITIKNTSSVIDANGVRLGSFGIDDIAPNVTSSITNNGVLANWTPLSNATMPNGFQSVEFCATVGTGPNCGGGGNNGILDGQIDQFEWLLTAVAPNNYGNDPYTIAFNAPIMVRFQSLEASVFGRTSIAFNTCSPTCNPPPPPPPPPPQCLPGEPCVVPEPGSLALASLAMIGLGVAGMRRRRR